MKRISTWILLSALATSALASATAPLPFIDDDFATARAEASRRKLPLFVDVWAPW
jgi:hypothetical protein